MSGEKTGGIQGFGESGIDCAASQLVFAGQLVDAGSSLSSPTANLQPKAHLPSFEILGISVHAVQMSEALATLRAWLDGPQTNTRFVAVTGMHGIAESRGNEYLRLVLNSAALVVPDGMPVIWVGRIKGFPLRHRVCGSELMDNFCRQTGSTYRHFFFGGAPGVAERLSESLRRKYGIVIAGTYTPPFGPLTADEEKALSSIVRDSAPDVFWVGLSTPKQEKWMYEHRNKLKIPVMLGVGAAFDMNSGGLRRAPGWMRNTGLEWLFRLFCEPRRLWRRYLVTIPTAVWFVCLELLKSSGLRPGSGASIRSVEYDSELNSSGGSS